MSNWYIGDWLQYGVAKWGERYAEAAQITGYDVKTLRNIVYVAKRFSLSRRRDKLTWSHHAELAVLEPDEQDRWLDRADADHLSVADLRIELRASQRGASRALPGPGEPQDENGEQPSLVCPHCGQTIALERQLDGQVAAA